MIILTILTQNDITIEVWQYDCIGVAKRFYLVQCTCNRCGDTDEFLATTSRQDSIAHAMFLKDIFDEMGVNRECSPRFVEPPSNAHSMN